MIIEENARAKINLFLHVLDKRDDGYHEIESLVVFPKLGDRVIVEEGQKLSLKLTGPFGADLRAGSKPSENTVMKAARALRDWAGIDAGAKITIEKNLPVASGIGGGSADAAAALRGLMHLWDVAPRVSQIRKIAASVGADVPACLASNSAVLRGTGADLHPSPPLPQLWFVLANPGTQVSTSDVYGGMTARRLAGNKPVKVPKKYRSWPDFSRRLADCRNDLEPVARKLAPEIGKTLSAINRTKGCMLARLSGSGATCYGLYRKESDALKAHEVIASKHPDWWSVVSSTI